ncbi:hypothetical protein Tco_1377495 [Tanacetum coccineum]
MTPPVQLINILDEKKSIDNVFRSLWKIKGGGVGKSFEDSEWLDNCSWLRDGSSLELQEIISLRITPKSTLIVMAAYGIHANLILKKDTVLKSILMNDPIHTEIMLEGIGPFWVQNTGIVIEPKHQQQYSLLSLQTSLVPILPLLAELAMMEVFQRDCDMLEVQSRPRWSFSGSDTVMLTCADVMVVYTGLFHPCRCPTLWAERLDPAKLIARSKRILLSLHLLHQQGRKAGLSFLTSVEALLLEGSLTEEELSLLACYALLKFFFYVFSATCFRYLDNKRIVEWLHDSRAAESGRRWNVGITAKYVKLQLENVHCKDGDGSYFFFGFFRLALWLAL